MKSCNQIISFLIVSLLANFSVQGQDTSGNNTGGPAFQEGATSGPSGQTDFQTDLFTGRFGYTVPLDLAPARHDSTPNVELIYNSANRNNWCGVGWNLDLGYIERETKYGVPILWTNGYPQYEYDDSKGFLLSFKNKTSDLVKITDGTWREQVQSDFLQFQLVSASNKWIVTDKSGNQYFFGSAASSRMSNPETGWTNTAKSGTFRWALDTIQTPTGDTASITYTNIGNELYPLTYKYNGHTNGVSQLFIVHFVLSGAARPDTTVSCLSGYLVYQQRLLTAIFHTVNGAVVWSNVLNYTQSPSTGRELLTSITRYGANQSSTLPPLTFGYSKENFTFQTTTDWGNLYLPSGGNQGYFTITTNDGTGIGPVAGEVCDLVDMDGDGLPDRVIHPPSSAPFTSLLVQHNNGSGFDNPTTWTIGSQSYDGDTTSTYEDFSLIQSSHARLIDINGDGKPDWVVDPYESYFNGGSSNIIATNYNHLVVQLNSSTNFQTTNRWSGVVDQQFANDGGGQTGNFRAVENLSDPSDGNTYVQMLDMNGDGLPDRVMVKRVAPYNYYVVQFNTGSGFGPTNVFGPYTAQGYTNDLQWAGLSGYAGSGNACSMRMIDINGDGLPDRVMLIHDTGAGENDAAPPEDQTYYVVELNNGHGFESPENWGTIANYYETICGGGYTPGIADLGDDYQVALTDINGDGLPDRIIACVCDYPSGYTNWFVQLNTGTGFASPINWGPTYSQGFTTDPEICGIQTSKATLIDINGDGLPDRVEAVYNLTTSANYFIVSLSSGPFPDLLTLASNGLGGFVSATYKPSTHYDNSQSPGTSPTQQLLPFPIYTVSSISVGDGIYPANTTTYSYSGGFWNFNLRQFNGFAQTTVTDPLGMSSIHWFHQAGGRDNSVSGEYADSTNTLGKEGMEFRTDTVGSNGSPYHLVLNQVNETILSGGQHFAYVTTNIDISYPATSSAYKATATQYYYDLGNGNMTNETDWGQVSSVTVSNESFTDVPGDTVYRITQFASLANTNIVDKPLTNTLSLDGAGENILRQTAYNYDGNTGNTLQELQLICPGTSRSNSYNYDAYGNRVWETNEAGIVTQTTYDSTYETFPANSTTAGTFATVTTYDARSGKLKGSINPAGLVTTNLYDTFLRLTETEVSATPNGVPNHWIEQYSYELGDSGGVPNNCVFIEQSDGVDSVNGHKILRYSDGLGRIVQVREQSETGNFRVIDSVYDGRGNPEFVSVPYFDSTTTNFNRPSGTELGTLHQYDPIGRPSAVTSGENGNFNSTTHLLTGITATGGDTASPLGSNTLAYYNGMDPWTLVVIDEDGKAHQFVRDAYGRTNQVVEVTSGGNFTTTYNYNLAGDLTNVTDSANNQIQYAYNSIGELVAMADPDMGIWQYQRDVAGRVRVQIDGDNQSISNSYNDPLGRLSSQVILDMKGNPVLGVTNVYDSSDDGNFPVYSGQLYKVLDNQGYFKTGYDVRGRKIITARYVAQNGNTYTNQYTSDDMDRVTSIIYPNGGPTVTNIYDDGANLSEVQQLGGSNTIFYHATSFTALDQVAGITFGNGISSSFTYYPNSHRLESIGTTGRSTNIQNLTYTYDQVADIMSVGDSVYSDGGSAAITNITYDDLHRLTSLSRPTLSQTVNFAYSSIGNMTSSGENGGTYTYAPGLPHAVLTANGQNYAYDRCGNMLVRGTQSLIYDPENRLVTSVASNLVTTFGYDADGVRLWKQGPTNTLQVWIDGDYEEKDGKILYHVSAGDRAVCTFSSDGTIFEYYHPDYLHSAEIQSDSSGNLYQHYEYSAYGQSRYTLSGTAFPISRRYTSQVLDEETGLYYYNARYYDPQLGRFIQPDTIIPEEFNPQAYDRYAYALDNPLRFTDPSGHAGKEVADWWQGHVNRVLASLTEGSESTLYIGTMGTVNSIVGGIADPLRLGSDAGRISATGGTAGEIALVTGQETLRAIAIIPVGAGIGKGGDALLNTVVKSGEKEVAAELAGKLSGCFVAGTLIPCESGDVPIQNVNVGDLVWSYSFATKEWELRAVEATPVHDYKGDIVTLAAGGVTITATGNHPFWVTSGTDLAARSSALDVPKNERDLSPEGRWVEARSLRPGDKLMLLGGRDCILQAVTIFKSQSKVYNLRIEGNHNYSVSPLGFLVHNKAAQVKSIPQAPDEGYLVRFGKGPETAKSLGDQAASAEAGGFPHGVSTKLKPKVTGSDRLHRFISKKEVEKVFKVMQTGSDPSHHTIVLPKPVTEATATQFNTVFPPIK